LKNIIGVPMFSFLHLSIGTPIMLAMQWKTIIDEIQESGLTQTEIAERCKCAQSTVSELASTPGRVPSWSIGAALLDLHKKTAKRKKQAA
jgi:predicted XRE-type DNA-binding protein